MHVSLRKFLPSTRYVSDRNRSPLHFHQPRDSIDSRSGNERQTSKILFLPLQRVTEQFEKWTDGREGNETNEGNERWWCVQRANQSVESQPGPVIFQNDQVLHEGSNNPDGVLAQSNPTKKWKESGKRGNGKLEGKQTNGRCSCDKHCPASILYIYPSGGGKKGKRDSDDYC